MYAQYPEELEDLYNDLPYLTERMIFEKVENLAANLHDEIEYVINIKTLKEALIWMNLGN